MFSNTKNFGMVKAEAKKEIAGISGRSGNLASADLIGTSSYYPGMRSGIGVVQSKVIITENEQEQTSSAEKIEQGSTSGLLTETVRIINGTPQKGIGIVFAFSLSLIIAELAFTEAVLAASYCI